MEDKTTDTNSATEQAQTQANQATPASATPVDTINNNNPVLAKTNRPRRLLFVIFSVVTIIVLAVVATVFVTKPNTKKTTTNTPSITTDDKTTLRVGTIIDENGVDADKKEFTPFINYLASQLHDQGITKAEFVPETSVSEMAKLMREGKVDIYVDSIFPVFVADRLSGSKIIANRWKEGVEKYHTAIFVKKTSPIKTVADLKGKIIAFDSPTSTVGYFLPKAELTKQGYTLTEKLKTTDSVAATEIGYTFVHDKVFDDVANGVTPVGAESEQEMRDHFGASFDQQYRIITTTPDVLRFLVTGRKDLAPSLTSSIKATLLGMDKTATGKTVL